MRILGCVTFILPLFTLAISQVASAPILARRTTTELESRSNEEISGLLERRNPSPEATYSPSPSSTSTSASTRRLVFRRHITSPATPCSYCDKRLLRRSSSTASSVLAKRTVAVHVERRSIFDKIREGFQVFNSCSSAFVALG
jgi:hypothetical protein